MEIILSVLLSYKVVGRIKCENIHEMAQTAVHITEMQDAIFIIIGLSFLSAVQIYIDNNILSYMLNMYLTPESHASLFFHLKISKPFPIS